MKHIIRGVNFLELSLDERVMLAHELLASVKSEVESLPLPADRRAEIVEHLAEVGDAALAA
jgi:hypothetical protein